MRDPKRAAFLALTFGLGILLGGASPAAAQAVETVTIKPDLASEVGAEPASSLVTQLADWVVASGDNRNLPFVIVDKVAAAVFVYAADGRLWGATPALLGLAVGDDSAPGVGDRPLSQITPEERTTPAGRFMAAFGPADGDRQVLWVDYATAISIHPVVRANPKDQRQKRLKSPTPADNRITFGCINVPGGFYEDVVRPALTGVEGVFYVLPETRPLEEVFPIFAQVVASAAQATETAEAEAEAETSVEQSEHANASDAVTSAGADATALVAITNPEDPDPAR